MRMLQAAEELTPRNRHHVRESRIVRGCRSWNHGLWSRSACSSDNWTNREGHGHYCGITFPFRTLREAHREFLHQDRNCKYGYVIPRGLTKTDKYLAYSRLMQQFVSESKARDCTLWTDSFWIGPNGEVELLQLNSAIRRLEVCLPDRNLHRHTRRQIATRRFLLRRACEGTSILPRETLALLRFFSNRVRRTINDIYATSVSLPPLHLCCKVLVSKCHVSVMLFFERICLATWGRIAPFPKGNNKLRPLFIAVEPQELFSFRRGYDPAYIFHKPFAVLGTELANFILSDGSKRC